MVKEFMNLAIREALIAYKKNEVPVGAVIVDENNNVISKAHNLVETYNNPTFHAEVLAIDRALKTTGRRYLNNCSIWVTLEPCVMCSGYILQSRLNYLYFGLEDKKRGSVENGVKVFHSEYIKTDLEIFFGFQEKRIKRIMQNFFLSIRK